MFEFIRKNNKLLTGLLMLLVIPSFILGGLELYQRAVGPGNGVAVVDGKAITQKDWDAVHRERVQQLRASQPGMDDSLLESDFAKYQTLERMVNDYMLAAWVHKHQLYVPDQRVQEALLQIPQVAALRGADGKIDTKAYADLLRQNGIDPAPYEAASRLRACLNQYGLLTGCKGTLSYAERRALFAEILADPAARKALRERLRNDPNRLLAVPYRIGVACNWPGLLAGYTMAKQRLL